MNLSAYLVYSLLLLALGLVTFRILSRRDYRRVHRLSPLTALLGTVVFSCWGGFPWFFGPADWPEVHVAPLLETAGWFCLWFGVATTFLAMAWLGWIRSFGRNQSLLRHSGPYRLTRNPQALACGLAGVGFALLWPSWQAAFWVLLYGVLVHTMILAEEEHLRRVHGEEYDRYCARVSRYLGCP
ncbi:MAG: methyltransferase family protein [Planctomycetota bacterium]|jgi:protein-S-isoprenylcysteine O-methyltransferase Ste14